MKLCPHCKVFDIQDDDGLNALSHDGKSYICNQCAQIESLEPMGMAEGLKIAIRRAQAAKYGLDKDHNPKVPK